MIELSAGNLVGGSALVLGLVLVGCGPADPNADAAAREYFAALKGKDTWMPVEEQLEHLNRAVRLAPDVPAYREARAGYLATLGHLAAARSDLDRAIELHDRPYLRFSRAEVLCELGDHALALADFDRAIAAQPENIQFYRGRSIARAALGQLPEALNDAELMIRHTPQHVDGYFARGVALAQSGRTGEAIVNLSRAIEMRPELAYLYRARAQVYEQSAEPGPAAADRAEAAHLAQGTTTICVDPSGGSGTLEIAR